MTSPFVRVNEAGHLGEPQPPTVPESTPESTPESGFSALAEIAAHIVGAPAAFVSVVDSDGRWFKAWHGSFLTEIASQISFCRIVTACETPTIVHDTLADARFATHPAVTGEPHIRFYAGFPLKGCGDEVLGSLCVFDLQPRGLRSAQVRLLEKLARQVVVELELRRKMKLLAKERRALLASEERLARVNELLTVVTGAQTSFLHGEPLCEIYFTLLERFLGLTDSGFGFIAEVLRDEADRPYLLSRAITNIAWDLATQEFFAKNASSGLEFHNLDTLFGKVLTTEQPVISNDPSTDPRRGGLPPGHPPLHAFMGLPVFRGDTLVGVVGMANRPGGYELQLAHFLAPLLATCGGIIETCRANAALRSANEHIEQAHASLRRSHDEHARILDLLSVATIVIDERGAITYASESCIRLAGFSRSVTGQPWLEVLPLDERARSTIRACLALPELERSRIGARLFVGDEVRHVEVDVRDDPREPQHRFLFIYDVSELYAHKRNSTRTRHPNLVGDSPAMVELYDAIDQVAAGTWTVLVEGETGTGKELVARAIHDASLRRGGPFVAVNCAGLTDTLLASALFGHVKGAFTGATKDQPGLFEAAAGGSVFLDEIGDISLTMQRTLLRVLQEREVTRVGETRPRKVDARIIAATHRDIRALCHSGEFREDLLYRIRIARIGVPPLRARLGDIPLLVRSFLADEGVTSGKDVREIDPGALDCLARHDWPGNVRELRGAIEHAVVRCREDVIRGWDLPQELQSLARREDGAASAPPRPRERSAGSARSAGCDEREAILHALRQAGGNRSKAAKLLGFSRATLYRRMNTYEIGD